MTKWQWFCQLCLTTKPKQFVFWQNNKPETSSTSGTAEVCTRLCGQNHCLCGGSMRGYYCVWTYYRE